VPLSASVLVLAAVAVVSLFIVDPVLALVALALIPTLVVVNRQFSRRMEGPASTGQQQLGVLGTLAHESFDGALVVKTLGRERIEVERFAAQAARLRDARIAVGRVRASFEPLFELLPAVASIAVVLAGAWRVSAGSMTTGQLVQAVTLFSVLTFPLRVLGFFLEQVPMAVVALDRVDGLLADGSGLAAPVRPRTLPPIGALSVAVEHLSQHHGQVAVLEDVSFDLAAGEVVALVGATGSGKSTLCELLVRLADPDEGRVVVGGVPLHEVDPAVLRQRVALVLQEPFLFADAVAANVLLDGAAEAVPGLTHHPHLDEALARARADGFVAELPAGPDTRLGERGVTLSGGQRQRLALARALALRPGLLILDDATSAVDPLIEAEILAGLRADPARPGGAAATLLIVAHRLSTIRLADRVLFLDQGRLVASGRHEDLLALPLYAGLARAYERSDTPPLDTSSAAVP
jgi:ABC-type multidrug transport system fused ATPase/permease subunit